MAGVKRGKGWENSGAREREGARGIPFPWLLVSLALLACPKSPIPFPFQRFRVSPSRVGCFSRALAFHSLYYPWGKMGTTRSLAQARQLKTPYFSQNKKDKIQFTQWNFNWYDSLWFPETVKLHCSQLSTTNLSIQLIFTIITNLIIISSSSSSSSDDQVTTTLLIPLQNCTKFKQAVPLQNDADDEVNLATKQR